MTKVEVCVRVDVGIRVGVPVLNEISPLFLGFLGNGFGASLHKKKAIIDCF